MEKINIMFYADNYTGSSGYSKVGRELSKRLVQDDRFDVCFQEITTSRPAFVKDGVKVLSNFISRLDPNFINIVGHHLRIFGPHIFIPISDTFLMIRDNLNLIEFEDIKCLPYCMIDSYDLADRSDEILDLADNIITGSKHGKNELKKAGYNSEVLYHGVNFDIYNPVDKEKQNKLKIKYGCHPTKTMFLFIGRNALRKRPMRLLEAIAKYNKKNPNNDAYFKFHVSDCELESWNLLRFVKRLEKKYNIFMDNVSFSDNYMLGTGLKEKEMAELYQACDFYITAATGEGFGFPIVESMACRKIVIAPDNTTHSEFLKEDKGILVDNEGFSYTGFGTYGPLVNVNKLSVAIEEAMSMSKQKYTNMSNKAYEWVKENCDWDKITDQLKEILLEVKNEK